MSDPLAVARNVAQSQAGERLAASTFALLASEIESSDLNDHGKAAYWRTILNIVLSRIPDAVQREVIGKFSPPQAKQSQPEPTPRKAVNRESEYNASTREAIADAEYIIENADSVPPAGEEFADSIAEKARSILASIEQRGVATDNQATSLSNMRSGLERWLERSDW